MDQVTLVLQGHRSVSRFEVDPTEVSVRHALHRQLDLLCDHLGWVGSPNGGEDYFRVRRAQIDAAGATED
jgi:flagellar basal body rod protein FlgF